MNQLKINNHIIAELPPDARGVMIFRNNGIDYIDYMIGYNMHQEPLPSGHTYTLLCKVPELTEEQAAECGLKKWNIGKGIIKYKDYEERYETWATSAITSLHSLLRSKGMNPETSIVIKEN